MNTQNHGKSFVAVGLMLIWILLFSGCSWFNPQAKLEQQTASDEGQELTYMEKVKHPPTVYFDLEAQIEDLFNSLNKLDFAKARAEYQKVQISWETAKAETGNIKGIKEADEALIALGSMLSSEKANESMTSLNKFTGRLGQLLMNYKLSPLADIVNLATISRNITWELEDRDFEKSLVRTEELKNTWEATKVNLEQPGILGEVTKAHDGVGKIRSAVSAENKMLAEDQLKKFNESLTKIRNFYKEKNMSYMP